jgi:homoserine O-succinyltransferase/O-acetyltransferase
VETQIKIAVLDLYDGEANEGMRCIRDLLDTFKKESSYSVTYEIFDVRKLLQIPSLDFDVYVSSGGPGSPLTSEGSEWEENYFRLMDGIQMHNQTSSRKKFVFLICHSFQVFCRFYGLAKVNKRKSTAFGAMPIHKTKSGKSETLFGNLRDPFWAVDSRDYQITKPDVSKIKKMGGQVLCLEKERPLVPLERATMAIRFNNQMIGTQFHPEADNDSLFMYLNREDKKKYVIDKYGEKKYTAMLQALNDPEKIKATHNTIIPTFLKQIERYHDAFRKKNLQPQL